MKILGIDPALTVLGYGVIEAQGSRINYLTSGLVKTKPTIAMPKRLFYISNQIEQIIELYKPDAIAMEETFVNKNPHTSLKLSLVRGALLSLIGRYDIDFFEYKPNMIKKTIVGAGHADKEQMKHMVGVIISGAPKYLTSDQADAVATAYCCFVHNY